MDFQTGDIICRENDPPRYIYFVLAGPVKISIRNKTLETTYPGQAVGLLSLLDEQPPPVTARAKEPREPALMDRKTFRYMVEEIPNFGWFVMGELGAPRAANAAV
jgi:CRP-like cAMP-binding protein